MANGDKVGAGRSSFGAPTRGPGSGIADTPIGKFVSGNLTREALLESEKEYLKDRAFQREVRETAESNQYEETVYNPYSELGARPFTTPELGLSDEAATSGGYLRDKSALKAPKRDQAGEIELSGVAPLDIQVAKRAAQEAEVQTQQLQLEARMAGYGLMADVAQDLGDELGVVADETRKEVEGYMDQADFQLGIVQELVDAARGNRINPNQFFANVGDAGKFSSSIAVAAGYMAQTSLGGVNLAAQIIDQAINRNVRAQEFNLLHEQREIGLQLDFVNKLRQLGVDRGNIGNMYQSMLIATTQAQLDSIKAATASAETRAQIDQLWAGLDARYYEGISAYYENIKAKMRFKYSTLRDGMMQARSAVVAGSTAISQAGGLPQGPPGIFDRGQLRGPADAIGPGRSAASGATGRRKSQPTEPVQDGGEQPVVEQPAGQGGVSPGATPEDRIKAIRKEVDDAGMDRNQALDHIQKRVRELGIDGVRAETMIPMDDLSVDDGEKVWIAQGENIGGWARANANYITANEKDRSVARKKVQARAQVVSWNHDAGELIAEIGNMLFPAAGSGSAARNIADDEVSAKFRKLNNIVYNIANSIRTEGGSDAIRAISEWAIWVNLAGLQDLGPTEGVRGWTDKITTAFKTAIEDKGAPELRRAVEKWKAGRDTTVARYTEEFDRWFIRPGTAAQMPGIPSNLSTGMVE